MFQYHPLRCLLLSRDDHAPGSDVTRGFLLLKEDTLCAWICRDSLKVEGRSVWMVEPLMILDEYRPHDVTLRGIYNDMSEHYWTGALVRATARVDISACMG